MAAAHAELVELLRDGEARHALLDQEGGDAARAELGFALGIDHQRVGVGPLVIHDLVAVEQVVAALVLGLELHANDVGAGAGLAHGQRADMFAGDQLGQVFGALGVGAVALDLVDAQVAVRAVAQAHRGGGARDFFHRDHVGQVAHAGAAVFLAHRDARTRPRSPILRHRSIGNWSLRSISAARGAISACANSRTASRSASMSSPSWKLSPGKLLMGWVSSRMGLMNRKRGSVGLGDRRQGLLHHGAGRGLAVVVHMHHLGGGHDDAFAALDHAAGGTQFAALEAGEKVDLVFHRGDLHAFGRHGQRRVAAGNIGHGAHGAADESRPAAGSPCRNRAADFHHAVLDLDQARVEVLHHALAHEALVHALENRGHGVTAARWPRRAEAGDALSVLASKARASFSCTLTSSRLACTSDSWSSSCCAVRGQHLQELAQLRPGVTRAVVHVDDFLGLGQGQAEALGAQRELEPVRSRG